jgi:signal transduction histidine kinase
MAVSIAVVFALAYWDEERESSAALTDFAREQATLAHGIAVALSARGPEVELPRLLSQLQPLTEHQGLRVFVAARGQVGLLGPGDIVVRSPGVERAIAQHAHTARLSRSEAAALGLPRRTAMAGLWPLEQAGAMPLTAVVVASAQNERDRELRARFRLLLSVSLASLLVLLFGGLAARRQRRQLELARELDIAALSQERDERLVRADKLATLGALATGIAHEVSTPLGVIIGRAEQVLPKVAHDERAKRAVEAIIDQGNRINQVIRGFLGLARGAGPATEHVNPRHIAEVCVGLVEHRFAKAGVHLTVVADPELPQIACEPRLFEQAVINLLLNACDACEPGGHVELQVRADATRVAFVVTDDGTGIAPEAAARVIEPFFTTKPEGLGTGLGLAIANEIVKHHQGSLSIGPRQASHAGERPVASGTRACVDLPAVKGAA